MKDQPQKNDLIARCISTTMDQFTELVIIGITKATAESPAEIVYCKKGSSELMKELMDVADSTDYVPDADAHDEGWDDSLEDRNWMN